MRSQPKFHHPLNCKRTPHSHDPSKEFQDFKAKVNEVDGDAATTPALFDKLIVELLQRETR